MVKPGGFFHPALLGLARNLIKKEDLESDASPTIYVLLRESHANVDFYVSPALFGRG